MATILEPPAALAPTEQVKAYLRVFGADEDALIAGLVLSATELCEAFTRVTLVNREIEETLPIRAVWQRLARAPVRSIADVSVFDASGTAAPLPAGDYAIDIDAAGDGWVKLSRSAGAGRALVAYRAGLATDWDGVPAALRQGIVRMAAHLYAHRDREDGSGPPAAVTALWLPYRRVRLS